MLSRAYATLFYESNRESILQLAFNLITYLLFIWILVMFLSLIRIVLYLVSIIGAGYLLKYLFKKSSKFQVLAGSIYDCLCANMRKIFFNNDMQEKMEKNRINADSNHK